MGVLSSDWRKQARLNQPRNSWLVVLTFSSSVALALQAAAAHLEASRLPETPLQAIKNDAELNGMREAHLRDAVALCELLYTLEKDVSSTLSHT